MDSVPDGGPTQRVSADLTWHWETRCGDAASLHDPDPPLSPIRTARELVVERPAIVLGSSQPSDDIDLDAARARGIDVARRRSGGGAVLLVPGEHVWIDFWLPASDPLWLDDVGRAGDWLADGWVQTLAELGHVAPVAHLGQMTHSTWSAQVCFAGLGPGEVTAESRKLVGVSQRRTREWARFQCVVHRRWDAMTTFGLLAAPGARDAGEQWVHRVAEVGDAPIRRHLEQRLHQ